MTVLGSTGSIGESTLDVVSRLPDQYKIIALTANKNIEKLRAQCKQFLPVYAVVGDAQCAEKLQILLRQDGLHDIQVLSGVSGLEFVASLDEVDQVMAAIVGAAGLLPTLAAAKAGKRLLLANKEALVMSGQLFLDEVEKNNAELLPIDSEHNAIFQCMPTHQRAKLPSVGVKRILLTSSGGPFLKRRLSELNAVTPDQACAHPNWAMGRKISVDSATMMNKGLEVIEAHWLFNASADDIQVVVHPQSVIHSMVEYIDGSVLAQMGNPDMRTPIAHAMAWPSRTVSGVGSLNLFDIARLDFEEPDFERFPCLQLAYDALREGGTASTVLNAANEIAVDAFLNETISFMHIPKIIASTMDELSFIDADSLDIVLAADKVAREVASEAVRHLGKVYG